MIRWSYNIIYILIIINTTLLAYAAKYTEAAVIVQYKYNLHKRINNDTDKRLLMLATARQWGFYSLYFSGLQVLLSLFSKYNKYVNKILATYCFYTSTVLFVVWLLP